MSSKASQAKNRREQQYWLGLSAAYGLGLIILAVGEGVWLWLFVPVFVLFLYLHARRYGQFRQWIEGRSVSLWIAGLATLLGVGAVLLNKSNEAIWAGPLLGVFGFVVIYLLLSRFGRFDLEPTEQG